MHHTAAKAAKIINRITVFRLKIGKWKLQHKNARSIYAELLKPGKAFYTVTNKHLSTKPNIVRRCLGNAFIRKISPLNKAIHGMMGGIKVRCSDYSANTVLYRHIKLYRRGRQRVRAVVCRRKYMSMEIYKIKSITHWFTISF